MVNSKWRASSLNVSALPLSSSSLPHGRLVSNVLPGSQLLSVSAGLPSATDTTYGLLGQIHHPSIIASTDFLSSSQINIEPRTESPEAFFIAALGSSEEKRVKRLVSVVRGFSKADEFSVGLHQNLSGWLYIFKSEPEVGFEDGSAPETAFEAGVAQRLRQLKQARCKMKEKWADTRLWLVFLAHEVEYISQWEHISLYTSRGVDSMSAAIKMATKYLDKANGDYKRGRNIIQVMKEGGPASLLESGCFPQSRWERFLALDDITHIFAYRRNKLLDLEARTDSHNFEVSQAILDGFMKYGWSFSELLDTNTRVMAVLKPYVQHQRQHTDGGLGDSGFRSKLVLGQLPLEHPDRKRRNVNLIKFEDPVSHEQQKSSEPPPAHVPLKRTHLWSHDSESRADKRKRSSSSTSVRHLWIPAAPFADNGFVFQFNRSKVSNSPSSPQALLVLESLFYNIKIYFETSCRNMILDDHGTLLTLNGSKLHNGLCNDFDSYCFTATMLKEKGFYVEFRRALSKAFALVEQILRTEHPRTLACFLEVFIHLIQTKLPEVVSSLRDFIKRMSAKVTMNGHPWSQICRLLGELDSESLDQAMAQCWKCITYTFDSELGTLSPLAVSVRLDYIKRVYGITNYLEEERLLRDLLAQFGGIPRLPTPRVMLNLAHNLNRQGRYDEAQEMTLNVLSLLQEYEIYAKRIVERIESLKIVSCSQFNQGKTLAAEQTMREAIQMIVHHWGRQHSWVSEFMNVLEGWLRGWGQEDAANTLRGEIEELMGKDEIDEQRDRVQGSKPKVHTLH
ncbi:hypothetical protein HYALB_00000972 [Hymenoscyphus albidus]|uniref:Uncharacterized protein n=1 Tax=Hymenoscyphus albidus TaxID=595503 RepID=A0A9N9M1W1_9HELO|nr:hypothetical protein HYALB_00000972 [Hymenoscyphus albidus]